MGKIALAVLGALAVLMITPVLFAQPTITLVSPDFGKAGDSVTISGSGFAQFFPENLVTFNGKPIIPTAGSSGSLTVTVPVGATTGPVEVRVGVFLSNGLPFTISPAGAFLNLSGININPANFHAFVSDSGAAVGASLIELDPFTLVGGEWMRTTRMGIANIRGLPLSADNRFYFSNASLNNFNQGTMSYWDLSTMVFGSWPRSAGTADTDPVACVAMGASPTNPNFLFFADRRNNEVRRVGMLARQRYAGGFDFSPDFSGTVAGFRGLAFNNNGSKGTNDYGDLYVSSGSTLKKVVQNPGGDPDDTTVTTVVSGLTTPAGLSFDDRYVSLHIADRSANQIGLYDVVSGNYESRLTGLSEPRMAALGQTNTKPPETRLYIVEPTRVVAADDQRVDMTPRENIRALISNCPRPLDTPGCAGIPYPSAYQTAPRDVQITATIHPPRASVTIYFDPEDPPDTSPYVTGVPNDNAGGPGTLSALSAPTDSMGRATTVLTITDRYSGDNYIVRARLSLGGPVVAKTGIITAWKRLFVEADKMFRQRGQYLTQDTSPGDTTLQVADSSRFSAGDIVLVFDADHQNADARTVQSTTPTSITLTSPVTIGYLQSRKAYVGRFADGFYEPDVSQLYRTFDDGFVEWMLVTDGSNAVPYEDATGMFFSSADGIRDFSALWFQNGRSEFDLTNYIHLIGARDESMAGIGGRTSAVFNYSTVYVQRIEDDDGGPGPDATNDVRDTIAHELGHQFSVNFDTDPVTQHDSNSAWCSGSGQPCDPELCVMNIMRTRTDEQVEFDVPNLNGSAEYGIRTIRDPR